MGARSGAASGSFCLLQGVEGLHSAFAVLLITFPLPLDM